MKPGAFVTMGRDDHAQSISQGRHIHSVVVLRLVAQVEPDELLGGEARDGPTTDPAGAEAVGQVLVDASFVADLPPEARRIERDRMEVHAATTRRFHHDANRPEIERDRVRLATWNLGRRVEPV